MIPKILYQVWLGGRMPSRYIRFREELMKLHPQWLHRLLDEQDAVRLIGESWQVIQSTYGTYTSISNYLRLAAVLQDGGVYLDMDFEAVKPMDGLLQYSAFTSVVDQVSDANYSGGSYSERICCAAFGAEAGHPWLKWQMAHYKKFGLKDPAWGVHLMSVAPRDGVTLVPTETFYPWHWDDPPAARTIKPGTLAAHHWDGDWRSC